MEKRIPFFEIYRGVTSCEAGHSRVAPHFRIGLLVYSRYLDFLFYTKVRHLFWRFWWRRYEWTLVRPWLKNVIMILTFLTWGYPM